jgi:putative oxidoreductase
MTSVVVNSSYFILRVVIGMALFFHGSQKVFKWFDGMGLDSWSKYLSKYNIPEQTSKLIALFEVIVGLLLITGAFTKFAALSAIVFMIFAVVLSHLDKGYFSTKGGYEYQLLIIAALLFIYFSGGGEYSIDKLIG